MSLGLSRGKPQVAEGHGLDGSHLPAVDGEDLDAARVDPRAWFVDPTLALEIEIGSGKGTFLVQQAAAQPGVNLLGIEHAVAFYRYAADRARRHRLGNARILHGDATDFLRYRCPDGVARVVHLYFSDPWPKSRHHKRRVVQNRTLDDMHRVLAPEGELRLVTDHDALWAWYEEHAERYADRFERRPFSAPPSAREGELVGTNYERKFAHEARPFHAMTLQKRG